MIEGVGDRFDQVPSCPDWDVRELVRHTGLIHLWAAAQLALLGHSVDNLDVLWRDADRSG